MAFTYINSLGEYTADNSTFSPDEFYEIGEYTVTDESFTVPASPYKINLDYIPKEQISTTITIDGTEASLIPWGETVSQGEVAIDMITGALEFNSNDTGKAVLASYTGIYKALMPYHLIKLGKELDSAISATETNASNITILGDDLDFNKVDGPATSYSGAFALYADDSGLELANSSLFWNEANDYLYTSGSGQFRFLSGGFEFRDSTGETSILQSGEVGNDLSLRLGDPGELSNGYGLEITDSETILRGPLVGPVSTSSSPTLYIRPSENTTSGAEGDIIIGGDSSQADSMTVVVEGRTQDPNSVLIKCGTTTVAEFDLTGSTLSNLETDVLTLDGTSAGMSISAANRLQIKAPGGGLLFDCPDTRVVFYGSSFADGGGNSDLGLTGGGEWDNLYFTPPSTTSSLNPLVIDTNYQVKEKTNVFSGTRSWTDETAEESHTVVVENGLITSWVVT